MTILRHSLPFMPGESLPSYTSRLAAHHGLSAREFCQDFGGRFQDIVDGSSHGVAMLAKLAGASPVDLASQALVRKKDSFQLAGERLTKANLTRDRLRACPACLAGDISESTLPSHIAAYGRTVWFIASIRTCPIHNLGVVEVAKGTSPSNTHDFSYLVQPALPNLRHYLEHSPQREASGLEGYLLKRLSGTRNSPFLDSLEFHVASKLCEMLGAVQVFGRTPNLKQLSDDDWWKAGAEGFAIASCGPAGIKSFLSKLSETYPRTRTAGDGPKAAYGRLYEWLVFGAQEACFDPIRDLIRQHVFETLPVKAGSTVLGEKVASARFTTIGMVAQATNIDSRRLTRVLEAAGFIAADQFGSTARILLSTEQLQPFLEKVQGALSLRELQSYLNAPPVQARLLIKHGFIVSLTPQAATGPKTRFAREEVDAFLEKLTEDAVPVDHLGDQIANIPAAAKHARCAAFEIISLILDRRLSWVGQWTQTRGYLSVMVNIVEVKSFVQIGSLPGYVPSELERVLKTTTRVVRALIDRKILPVVEVKHPASRRMQGVVPYEVIETFQRDFVSLFELATERGVHFRALKQDLKQWGIEPAFDPEEVKVTLYRRAELPPDRVSAHPVE